MTAAALCGLFAAYAWWRIALPGVNEPHYLCKARHFYQPDWCARDLFLASSNPHALYYAVIGPLTLALPFEATALFGRIAGYLAVAAGWLALHAGLQRQLDPPGERPETECRRTLWLAAAAISAPLFLAIQAAGTLSGEWLIGGTESKVFAYACAFWSLGELLRLSTLPANMPPAAGAAVVRCAAALGLTIGLHPVIGLWHLGAVFAAVLWSPASLRRASALSNLLRRHAPAMAASALAFVATSLPGCVSALTTISAGGGELSAQADRIQVFDRLAHHLNPARFSAWSWSEYALLGLGWGLLAWRVGRLRRSPLTGYLTAAAAAVLAGVAVRFGLDESTAARLLKFYPFRLLDMMLPVLLAATAGVLLIKPGAPRPDRAGGLAFLRGASWRFAQGSLAAAAAIGAVAFLPAPERTPRGLTPTQRTDWADVCRWLRANTAEDALVVTPHVSWAFKWYAQRAEYVAHKDCPQDAPSIVEWKRRMDRLLEWRRRCKEDGVSPELLTEIAVATGAEFFIDNRPHPDASGFLFRNESYVVYKLPAAGPSPTLKNPAAESR